MPKSANVNLRNAELWFDSEKWRLQLWTRQSHTRKIGDLSFETTLAYDRTFPSREEAIEVMRKMLKGADAPSELLAKIKSGSE